MRRRSSSTLNNFLTIASRPESREIATVPWRDGRRARIAGWTAAARWSRAGKPVAAPDPAIAPPPTDIQTADATLRRGTRFLAAGLRSDGGRAHSIAGRGRARVIGNGLREVDRFLALLIDAVGARILDAPGRRALHRLDNSARKLGMLRAALALASPDDAALRAIGRSRACLFHTGGVVRGGGPQSRPTAGWAHPDRPPAEPGPARLPPGSRILVSAADLGRIRDFYDRIADDLLAAAEQFARRD